MKISEETIQELRIIINGDYSPSQYRKGGELISFFNKFSEEQEIYGEGFPSRWKYTEDKLLYYNCSETLPKIIQTALDPRRFLSNEINLFDLVENFNLYLKFDGFILRELPSGFFEVQSIDIEEDPAIIDAHFSEIKSQIIENIRSADFLIWVAVAWFTDRDLGNELFLKHRDGVNIQIIVNDDEITSKNGLRFEDQNFEYYKLSPLSPWGKKIMHNKFCIIDLKKVIHGSYNWTTSAQYNNETITVTKERKITEEFAKQFIQLKLNYESA